MTVCAECKTPIPKNIRPLQERLEYVTPDGKKRLRTVPLRLVCGDCAERIADTVKKAGKWPTLEMARMVKAVRAYMNEPNEATWDAVTGMFLPYALDDLQTDIFAAIGED